MAAISLRDFITPLDLVRAFQISACQQTKKLTIFWMTQHRLTIKNAPEDLPRVDIWAIQGPKGVRRVKNKFCSLHSSWISFLLMRGIRSSFLCPVLRCSGSPQLLNWGTKSRPLSFAMDQNLWFFFSCFVRDMMFHFWTKSQGPQKTVLSRGAGREVNFPQF